MKKFLSAICLIVVLGFPLLGQKNKLPKSLSEKIDLVRPTVVRVTAEPKEGTGFIVSPDGYIVTALHVVQEADGSPTQKVGIGLPFETLHSGDHGLGINMIGDFFWVGAAVVDTDKVHDLALLKSDQNPLSTSLNNPKAITFGSYSPQLLPRAAAAIDSHRLKDGEPIFISGYPLSMAILLTTSGAIASSEGIDGDGGNQKDVYWADVQANHGNSGGPVFSLDTCKVVGMQRAVRLAPVDFLDGTPPPAFGVAIDSNKLQQLHAISGNSGLTEIIPASAIADLLTKNHVVFSR